MFACQHSLSILQISIGTSSYECRLNERTLELEPFYSKTLISTRVLFLITFAISLLGTISFFLVTYFPQLFKEKQYEKYSESTQIQTAQLKLKMFQRRTSDFAFSRHIDAFILLACYGLLIGGQAAVLPSIKV